LRRNIVVRIKQGEKWESVQAVLWENETPPEYRRGNNRKMKNRSYKRNKMALIEEEKLKLIELGY